MLALILGVWKYREMMTSENHLAHPYVDIAHRAALLYSFATLLIAVFVQLSAWPVWVNLAAAGVLVFFFLAAIWPTSATARGATPSTSSSAPPPDCGGRWPR